MGTAGAVRPAATATPKAGRSSSSSAGSSKREPSPAPPAHDRKPSAGGNQAEPARTQVPGPADAQTAEAEIRRPLVLALDDEPSIRAFLGKALSFAGLDCVAFPDGLSALDGVRETDFDVMLIDHRMAGMSGTDFYEAAIELRPELARRAVFMSGDVLNPDLRGFATERDIRLLAKPFDIEAVIQVVREVLASSERQADPSQGSA
jgi:CheY-like chemotaxis protein